MVDPCSKVKKGVPNCKNAVALLVFQLENFHAREDFNKQLWLHFSLLERSRRARMNEWQAKSKCPVSMYTAMPSHPSSPYGEVQDRIEKNF